jgi:hypothetical protein
MAPQELLVTQGLFASWNPGFLGLSKMQDENAYRRLYKSHFRSVSVPEEYILPLSQLMQDWNTCPAEVAVNLLSSHMMSSGLVESKTLPHDVPQGESLATKIAVVDIVKSRKATIARFQPAIVM